jgi:membrane-associated phospholipid phosphatase
MPPLSAVLSVAAALVAAAEPIPAVEPRPRLQHQPQSEPRPEPPTAPQTEPALKRGLKILAEDSAAVFSSPARWGHRGWIAFGGTVAGTALVVTYDDEILAEVRESDAPDRDDFAERIEELGRPEVGAILPLISYGIGRMTHSRTLAETSLVAFEAWLLTAASTAVLKGATGREGPADGGENDFWEGGDLFPSGHTSRTFAIAAAIAERHGRRAAWIGYPVAALVGLARIETGAHWASDVAAGAALGIAIGRAVGRRHPLEPAAPAGGQESRLDWSLIPVPSGAGLQIRFTLEGSTPRWRSMSPAWRLSQSEP